MRLGGPIFKPYEDPETWVKATRQAGYRAAYCPVGLEADAHSIALYAKAAQEADIMIAEVGAWSNPLSPNESERNEALEKCKRSLDLADQIGARCCVNIAGSRGKNWDGPCALDLTEETFEMIVELVREIIDSVQPRRTYFSLETMPWMYPDSVDSYERLIRAIERKAFAVHFDPVNLISSPQRYFTNKSVIKEFVTKLGAYIRSCHAKDITLHEKLTVHLDEVRPGLGGLDYPTLLQELNSLADDVPVMLEHLLNEEEYSKAANYIRKLAREQELNL